MAYLIPANMVYDALAATYTHGVDAKMTLDSAADFPAAPGGVVFLDDGEEWVVRKYTAVVGDDLDPLAVALAVNASAGAGGHVFASGTVVKLGRTADYLQPIVSDIVNAPAGAIFYEDTDEIGSSASFTFDGTTFKCDKAAVFNESGADVDWRVEAVGIGFALSVQGSDGFIGIGTGTPAMRVHIDSQNAVDILRLEKSAAAFWDFQITNLDLMFLDRDGNARITFFNEGRLGIEAGAGIGAHTDDYVHLWVEDVNAAAGFAGLHMMGENGASSIKQIVVGVVIKGTAGQTANPHEGLIEINTNDNSLKMYAEGAWRDIAAGW